MVCQLCLGHGYYHGGSCRECYGRGPTCCCEGDQEQPGCVCSAYLVGDLHAGWCPAVRDTSEVPTVKGESISVGKRTPVLFDPA